MLEWLLIFIVLWISISIITIATSWYFAETIRPFFPKWWKRYVADDEPQFSEDSLEPRVSDETPRKWSERWQDP